MTTRPDDDAGRVLMVGLPSPGLDAADREALRTLRPGGVILFRRNLDTPARAQTLVHEVREILDGPAFIAIDQEGGRVSRLEPWIGPTPTAVQLAAAGPDGARAFGRATGLALAALGCNLDFAPVADLCDATAPNGIGDRSFGTDPATVTRLAGAFLDGLQSAGVAGCLKHFPGLGDTAVDSHEVLPVVDRDIARLQAEDIVPYRSLGGSPACVMVGHGCYPALDATEGLPATLSRTIVHGLLRERLGYDGLIVSDDLEMGAVAPLDGDGRAAVAAVDAGCELVLYCSRLDLAATARRALIRRAESDDAFGKRLRSAATRVRSAAERWPITAQPTVPWERTRREVVEIAGAILRPDRGR